MEALEVMEGMVMGTQTTKLRCLLAQSSRAELQHDAASSTWLSQATPAELLWRMPPLRQSYLLPSIHRWEL